MTGLKATHRIVGIDGNGHAVDVHIETCRPHRRVFAAGDGYVRY